LIEKNGDEFIVRFVDIKFSHATYPNLVSIKFLATVALTIDSQVHTKTIESLPSRKFVCLSNQGSQWKEGYGMWMKEKIFQNTHKEVSLPRLFNHFQNYYLDATKQSPNYPNRPLELSEFTFILNSSFQENLETMRDADWSLFWDWIGPALKKIRFQKHLAPMFEEGFLACFVTEEEARSILNDKEPGTFLIRLSEWSIGGFVISYRHSVIGVRHYLVQPEDIDRQTNFVDFLRQSRLFLYILQLHTFTGGIKFWTTCDKDKALQKFYKKRKRQHLDTGHSTCQLLNNEDISLPHDLQSL